MVGSHRNVNEKKKKKTCRINMAKSQYKNDIWDSHINKVKEKRVKTK